MALASYIALHVVTGDQSTKRKNMTRFRQSAAFLFPAHLFRDGRGAVVANGLFFLSCLPMLRIGYGKTIQELFLACRKVVHYFGQ